MVGEAVLHRAADDGARLDETVYGRERSIVDALHLRGAGEVEPQGRAHGHARKAGVRCARACCLHSGDIPSLHHGGWGRHDVFIHIGEAARDFIEARLGRIVLRTDYGEPFREGVFEHAGQPGVLSRIVVHAIQYDKADLLGGIVLIIIAQRAFRLLHFPVVEKWLLRVFADHYHTERFLRGGVVGSA